MEESCDPCFAAFCPESLYLLFHTCCRYLNESKRSSVTSVCMFISLLQTPPRLECNWMPAIVTVPIWKRHRFPFCGDWSFIRLWFTAPTAIPFFYSFYFFYSFFLISFAELLLSLTEECRGKLKKTQSKRWKMKWIKTCVPPIVRSWPCQNCLATVIYGLLEKPLSWWYLSPNVFRHAVCKVYGICCAINTWKTLFAVCFCFVLFSSHPNIPKRLAAVFSES